MCQISRCLAVEAPSRKPGHTLHDKAAAKVEKPILIDKVGEPRPALAKGEAAHLTKGTSCAMGLRSLQGNCSVRQNSSGIPCPNTTMLPSQGFSPWCPIATSTAFPGVVGGQLNEAPLNSALVAKVVQGRILQAVKQLRHGVTHQ